MKIISAMLAAAVLLAAPSAKAVEVVKHERSSLDVGGRLQLVGIGQSIDDQIRDKNRLYLFVRQARLSVYGHVDDFKYKVQLGFAGEDEAKAPSPGVSLGLLDMYADVPLHFLGANTYVRVGQFKVPYSLERLVDTGEIAFSDRSVNNVGFRVGRDYGVAVHSSFGDVKGAVGIFSGGGRDVPERYLPMVLGIPMVVARVGYDHGMYENAFAESAEPTNAPAYAAYFNGFYLHDSQIGHSTVLNVHLGERGPARATPRGTRTSRRARSRAATSSRSAATSPGGSRRAPGAVTFEAEANHGQYSNEYGKLGLTGGRVQAGYAYGKFEGAVRYAVLRPDQNMASGGISVAGGKLINEVTPGIIFNQSKNLRVVADLPILINAPVITERNLGDYVLMEQPDQASLLKTPAGATEPPGSVSRKTVIEARLLFQAQF